MSRHVLLAIALTALPLAQAFAQERTERLSPPPPAGTIVSGRPAAPSGSAVVNFADLARKEALGRGPRPPARPRLLPEESEEALDEPMVPGSPEALITPPPFVPFAASPPPSFSFMGLDDIRMVDSSYFVIPPDCDGAVGPTKVLSGLNNNYRIFDKTDGSVLSTVGTVTFWYAAGPGINTSLTDPHTVYDAIQNRWIVCMISDFGTGNSAIELGVSQTSDPSGNWFLVRYPVSGGSVDFPIMGFNKNWVVVTSNLHANNGSGRFQNGVALVVNYPLLRSGTLSAKLFTQANGTHFCTAPCLTYSSTQDTLFLVTHLNSPGATYVVDRITGTPSSPVYTTGSSQSRLGGGWAQPRDNILPQSPPNSGQSACGSTPCPIHVFDAQVRSAPVYRDGLIYYTQTVGLPSSGTTHTAVQWTKVRPPAGTFVDGGRIEDPTANASNGGKWYAFSHIAVNSAGDFIVGFTQYSSSQHPASGYAVHLATDAPGTIRDATIYHAGEDYYHKTFNTTTSRNRWGDYSKAQVDPSDDRTLWVVTEYARARVGTDDGNTGSNSSRWGTWWAKVPVPPVAAVPIAAARGRLDFDLASVGPIPSTGPVGIEYTVGRKARVRLSVVDLEGRMVATLVTGVREAGRYRESWERTADTPPGVYFIRYQAAGRSLSRRIVVTE